MSEKKSVIIFGGLGYVGDPLIESLKDEYNVTVVDPNWFDNFHKFHNVRYLSKSTFDFKSINADFCIYLAAVSNDPMGVKFSDHTYLVNEYEAIRIAELCKSSQKEVRFILASSCSVYGSLEDNAKVESDHVKPITDYAKSKINAELGLEKVAGENLKVICLRFATACGVSRSTRLDLALNDFVISALTTGKIEILSDGMPWRPFINVKDMAMSMKYSLNAPIDNFFQVYNVGSKVFTFRIKELAEYISKLTNAKISIADTNPTDSRSYTVNFSKFETWYKRKWPLHLLEDTVEELTNFYLKKIEKYGKDHFNDFRNSTQYFRLKMLQQKNSNPRTKLF